MKHPHKPYIKAYLIYGIIGGVVFFAMIIPVGAILIAVNRLFGEHIGDAYLFSPLFRLFCSSVIGYFVFREVVRRTILPHLIIREDSAPCNAPSNPAHENTKDSDNISSSDESSEEGKH